MQDIIEEIETWEAEAMERQWRAAINNIPAAELDSWPQFTKWPKLLGLEPHSRPLLGHLSRYGLEGHTKMVGVAQIGSC
jgi:hypothetical protein